MMMAMKAKGISDGQPSNPTFVELVKAGASKEEFESAAVKAVEQHKGFGYAIGIVVGERKRAAELAKTMPRGPLTTARATAANETFREKDDRVARERWEEMTGRQHPDSIPTLPAVTQYVEDITPKQIRGTA